MCVHLRPGVGDWCRVSFRLERLGVLTNPSFLQALSGAAHTAGTWVNTQALSSGREAGCPEPLRPCPLQRLPRSFWNMVFTFGSAFGGWGDISTSQGLQMSVRRLAAPGKLPHVSVQHIIPPPQLLLLLP